MHTNYSQKSSTDSLYFTITHCNYCHKSHLDADISRCARCKIIGYCSTDCQKRDWGDHKTSCLNLKQSSKSVNKEQNSPALQGKQCTFCKKTVEKIKQCSACKFTLYCSIDCQKNDRKNHKSTCSLTNNLRESLAKAKKELKETLQTIAADKCDLGDEVKSRYEMDLQGNELHDMLGRGEFPVVDESKNDFDFQWDDDVVFVAKQPSNHSKKLDPTLIENSPYHQGLVKKAENLKIQIANDEKKLKQLREANKENKV